MTDQPPSQPAGWYYAEGDPPGTQRYWDGTQWQGGPQAVPAAGGAATYGAAALEYASPWSRLLARIIDFVILLIPLIIVAAIVGGGLFGVSGSFGEQVLSGIVTTAIFVGYEYYFLAKDGATPGKKAASVKVVLEDGSELGSDGAMRRLILTALQIIPVLGSLIGLVVGLATVVMIFIDDRRQVPADKIAKSVVIKT